MPSSIQSLLPSFPPPFFTGKVRASDIHNLNHSLACSLVHLGCRGGGGREGGKEGGRERKGCNSIHCRKEERKKERKKRKGGGKGGRAG